MHRLYDGFLMPLLAYVWGTGIGIFHTSDYGLVPMVAFIYLNAHAVHPKDAHLLTCITHIPYPRCCCCWYWCGVACSSLVAIGARACVCVCVCVVPPIVH